MPLFNRVDAADLDQRLKAFFDSLSGQRAQALRQIFVEKLDFSPATGIVSLANAPKAVSLPSSAERIAARDGVQVVFVPLAPPDTDRVRKAEAATAAKLINDTLHGDLLLLMTNTSGSQLHVVYPAFATATPTLRRMVVERDLPRRTVVQQLSNLYWDYTDTRDLRGALERAFDVDAVTDKFFKQYKRTFESVFGVVRGFESSQTEQEAKKLFVQTLFNRLMFIYFLSRKGWLKFAGDVDYLNALWKDYRAEATEKDFYESRLKLLFFTALNNPDSRDLHLGAAPLIGEVPFLNGGLFDKTDEDKRVNVEVPDPAIDQILHELFDRFNFTVMESTPLDVEVAVDPEMLGKVFEELVTGRHASGSYYTPRLVVSFMCREALEGYLHESCVGETEAALDAFVNEHKSDALQDAESILAALKRVRVCDPACGSGAYLLGMLHELLDLRQALFATRGLDAPRVFDRKLEIIQNNLYGVDIDKFAVNIAMLRLWLSLAVEYDGRVEELPPLPNLDFKIVCGDSLLAPDPNPQDYGTLFRHRVHELAGQVAELKNKHMRATGQAKADLSNSIGLLKAQLREASKESIPSTAGVVDWRVEFPEVFDSDGGFAITIMNPPFVATYSKQSEKVAIDQEPQLRQQYGAYSGRINLFWCFIVRSLQLTSPRGAVAVIVPDSYATSDSYERIRAAHRQRLSRHSWTLIKPPVFGANVRNVIVVARPGNSELRTVVAQNEDDLNQLHAIHQSAQDTVWGSHTRISFLSSRFEQVVWGKLSTSPAHLRDRFETRDGVNPGPRTVRDRIVNPIAGRSIRPLIEGSDIDNRGLRIRYSGQTILYDPAAISLGERKAGASLRDPSVFSSPKIVSRQTADTIIAAMDLDGDLVTLNSVHCTRSTIGSVEELWGLLGVLNSPLARLFYAIDGGETREILPQVHVSWLMDFPLPNDAGSVLTKLAPQVITLYDNFDRDQVRVGCILQLHGLVCSAYGLDESEQAEVLDAYLRRYPRYRLD